jgi:CRP-like cAMP-binding protein
LAWPAVYTASGLAIVNLAFDVPIRGVLATSGVIAIVLGLALQSSLADVFSGIAVGLERPFRVGDLIWVEGSIEGEVVQMNWRSTQISTGQNNIAVVPNSIIAKSRLVNRSLPTPARGDKIEVKLDALAPPARCIAVLTAAADACRKLLAVPAPSIACTGLFGDGNLYEVDFSVASTADLMAARSELLRNVHQHLRYAGIALGVTGRAAPRSVPVPTSAQLLAESDLFGVIEPTQRDVLAGHLKEVSLSPGETLIQVGGVPDALFVVAEGAVEITVPGSDGPRVVHRMSPGESIGAIGLITGAPYSATATALSPVKAYRLDKAAIAAAISAMPELKAGLEDLARRGQKALREDAAAQVTHEPVHAEMFLSRLRNFLSLLGQ